MIIRKRGKGRAEVSLLVSIILYYNIALPQPLFCVRTAESRRHRVTAARRRCRRAAAAHCRVPHPLIVSNQIKVCSCVYSISVAHLIKVNGLKIHHSQ